MATLKFALDSTECTPKTMKYFSATRYFVAKRLQDELKNVPSALITSWSKLWKSDFSFYYVQIAPYKYEENQFEIAGADGIFYEVVASIKKNNVILQSDKISNPVKVRYSWKNTDQSNLFNKANLPASSFITE